MTFELMNSIEKTNKRQFHFHRVKVPGSKDYRTRVALKPGKGKVTLALGDRDLCKTHLHVLRRTFENSFEKFVSNF